MKISFLADAVVYYIIVRCKFFELMEENSYDNIFVEYETKKFDIATLFHKCYTNVVSKTEHMVGKRG